MEDFKTILLEMVKRQDEQQKQYKQKFGKLMKNVGRTTENVHK